MYIENNPLRFVSIENFRKDVIKEMKARNINGAYFGESFILTTSDKSYDRVYDVISEIVSDNEIVEEIKSHFIKNIEDYVECVYEQEYYEILGVDGCMADQSENVMESIVFMFNDGILSEEELSNWESLIDKITKQHVMENVMYELKDKLSELKEQGYNIQVLRELFK